MNNFIHKNIRRFYLDGQIHDDSFIPRLREEYIRILETQMRLQGYAPRLDIEPDFTIEYTGKYYNFRLSVYGAFVGKRSAECITGIDKNKPIYTQKSKSEDQFLDQASRSNQN